MDEHDDFTHKADCSLCVGATPVLWESHYWLLVLNRNQNLLGKCMLVLRRHLEVVAALTAAEWAELQGEIQRATGILQQAFAPDHFNYAFLQNQDRHVHLHIIPRYAGQRGFAGQVWEDPDYPNHYAVPAPVRLLEPATASALVAYFQEHL
jgi:diadenosine tetraphosphate (Ap4A) HIT family hydrolase